MSLLCKKALHRCQLTWLLLAAAAAAVLLVRLVRRRRRRPKTRQGKLKIAFAHPDLGIGGAERLVVDAALGLRGRGHDVTIYTARHDPRRCFDETRDGTLRVVVAGDWLPKRVLGRCYALCASLRMVAVALRAARDGPDVVVVDQVATAVPVARAACAAPVVFYCHYPDKLLCVNRQNPLTRLYRAPLDWCEETCTGLADVVLVNSRFTAGVFRRAFPRLGATAPEVLYPPLSLAEVAEAPRDAALLLSINRFERKKNLGLAVEALALLPKRVRLVLAGGYDPDLPENVEHARELEELAARLGVADRVTQRRSVSGDEKARLLARCACLLYTPENEHFGIVPLEAMHARTPVVAVDSGGPRESVVDGVTGRLLAPDPQIWARAVADLLGDAAGRRAMGERGRERVRELFSLDAFADRLERICVGVLTR